jgi:hypothetical protein
LVEPELFRVIGQPTQAPVLLDVDHRGLLLAAPGDDRRGLVPMSTIDDVSEVTSDLGHTRPTGNPQLTELLKAF